MLTNVSRKHPRDFLFILQNSHYYFFLCCLIQSHMSKITLKWSLRLKNRQRVGNRAAQRLWGCTPGFGTRYHPGVCRARSSPGSLGTQQRLGVPTLQGPRTELPAGAGVSKGMFSLPQPLSASKMP